jgi:hypothetical protein
VSTTQQEGIKQSKAVQEATTLKETGFPVTVAGADGSTEQVMATKAVDPETGETVIEGENGVLEISSDAHVLQPEGTAEAQAKAAADAGTEDTTKRSTAKSG